MITHCDDEKSLQRPFDVAVVIPTILRPSLLDAVQSVFRQTGVERVQTLIGVDGQLGDPRILDKVLKARPKGHAVAILDLGYSMAGRNGGLYADANGGAMRTVLSYAANSRYVAYLDDDNWWDTRHLSTLLAAIAGKDWAYSLRWFVHQETREPLYIDIWESVGPGRGIFCEEFDGWVDPNCLMIDKLACEPVLRWWSIPLPQDAEKRTGDRMVYGALVRDYRPGFTGEATAFYALSPGDSIHPTRMERLTTWIARRQALGRPPLRPAESAPPKRAARAKRSARS